MPPEREAVPMAMPPSLKLTVPVGKPPLLVTAALNVTVWVAALGLGDEVSVVVVVEDCCTALNVIAFELPVIEAVTVSVAVMVWAPALFSVAENVPAPL